MEYELVNLKRHPHPLLFERDEKCDRDCRRCRLPLFGTPSFRCSDSECDYQIHQSCLHLTSQINSSFHPHHPLSLRSSGRHCDACGQTPSLGEVYRCDECKFVIDIKCAIADVKLSETSNGKYVHISHQQHPLTLSISQQNETKKHVYCVVCELAIQSGSSIYFCEQCDDDDAHFHKECAEIEIERQIPDHPHPLHLRKADEFNHTPCRGCRNEVKLGFFYSCFECKFFSLHIPCLQSFNHEHNFTRIQHNTEFTCGVCGEKSRDRFVFICNICYIMVHQNCVQLPITLRIYEHIDHDLSYIKYFSPPKEVDHIDCKICGKYIEKDYGGYGCTQCNYFTHVKCAKGLCEELYSVAAGKQNIEHLNNIHHHNLTVFAPKEIGSSRIKGEYKVCDGCMKCFSNSESSYGCAQCDFYIHEECAKFPTNTKSQIHSHTLTLISLPNFLFQCEACLQHFQGFAYQCKTCFYTFDTRCASIQTPFLHPSHEHPLFPNKVNGAVCDHCGKYIEDGKIRFQCAKPSCIFKLDLRCATMPVIVRYRFDQHPLNLTFLEEERNEEYYCDVCEEKRRPGVWFYSCNKCNFQAHQECVVGEFPFVKSTIHKYHKHPLNLVTNGENENDKGCCGACNNELSYHDLAFKCGACRFKVHATGPCYRSQIHDTNLAFTNYNIFSRANQPYAQSIPKLQVMELVQFGSSRGARWKESVFSSIRAFVVYHSKTSRGIINCIQIQYVKKGELVWSFHGKEEGTRSEVFFEYPDEYLVSIHGSCCLQTTGYIVFLKTLCSLTLETNRKMYGPFGIEKEEDKFSSPKDGVKIVGIFGYGFDTVESIGFLGFPISE